MYEIMSKEELRKKEDGYEFIEEISKSKDIDSVDMPPGRTPVKTYVVDKSYEIRINNFLKKNIDERKTSICCMSFGRK